MPDTNTPTKKPRPSLLHQGSSLGLFTLGSRILGLLREMVKASYMGTTPISDAFSVAFLIPNLFRRLFAENSMTVAFIPTFREYYDSQDGQNIRQFLSATFTLLLFAVSITTGLGILFTPALVPLFGTSTGETIILTRIMFPYLAIISMGAFFQGILNGIKIFNPSGFTPILFNICVIGFTILLTPYMENPGRAMAIGVLIGGFVQAGFQLPFVLKQGFGFGLVSIKKSFQNPGTRMVLKLIGPTIIGMAAYQINDIVSTALAGQAGVGVVSSLGYSLRLQELILGIFAVTIGTIILPGLSSFATKKAWPEFYEHLEMATKTIAVITIPLALFAWIYGEQIIILLFRSQAFGDDSVRLTLAAFQWHIVGLYFIALNRILAPAFYAQKDSKSPTWAGLLNFAVNISLASLLVGPMKGAGIALALSIASFCNTLALFAFFRKKSGAPLKHMIQTTFFYGMKLLGLSIIAMVPVFFLGRHVFQMFGQTESILGRIGAFGIPLTLLALLYGVLGIGLLAVFKDRLVLGVFRRIRHRN